MKRRVLAVVAALGLLGAGAALAVGETTGTNVSCSTVPAQTISANGAQIGVIPAASHCETVTYTIPTSTVTGPTTTVTSTVTTTVGSTTTPAPTAAPAVPTGLTATAGDGQVTLSWDTNPAGDQVDEYQVYKNDATLELHVVGTTYTATGLTNGTAYTFRVSAHNVVGYGNWTASVSVTPQAAAPAGTVDWNGDWETGDRSAFANFECPYPATQFAVQQSIVRQGQNAAMFHIETGTNWTNGSARCLVADYNNHLQGNGDEFWYGFSEYLATPIDTSLLWELHQGSNLYNTTGCGVAPFALNARAGKVQFRIATGDCASGAPTHAEWNIDLFPTQPLNVWLDFVVHIKFTEANDGVVEVWAKQRGDAWPATPTISRSGIPTNIWNSTTNAHGPLYMEMGIYGNYSPWSGSETVYNDGFKRGSSFAAVAP